MTNFCEFSKNESPIVDYCPRRLPSRRSRKIEKEPAIRRLGFAAIEDSVDHLNTPATGCREAGLRDGPDLWRWISYHVSSMASLTAGRHFNGDIFFAAARVTERSEIRFLDHYTVYDNVTMALLTI